jgi:cytochrome c-type biogenesis protein CcmH/NrfG
MAEENKPLDSIEFDHKQAVDEPEPEKPETPLDRIKKALTEVRRSSTARTPARREMGKDRTKSLVLLAGAAVGMVLMFLGVFSSPQKPQKVALRQMTPDLGLRRSPELTRFC